MSVFEIVNSGTETAQELKIIVPDVLAPLRRDFDEIPKEMIAGQQVTISAGLSLGSSHQYEFQVSWRCGLLTKRHRKITAQLV
ncbi:MAG: hypothetical protein HYV95_14960 [Opitutae bacterium]|nr:hypothetical protein [Opitutae bacterium]